MVRRGPPMIWLALIGVVEAGLAMLPKENKR